MRLGRGVFVFDKDFSPCRLQASLTRSTAQMRTPLLASPLGERIRKPLTVAKNKGHPHGVSLFFGAGRGIRTPVPFGQTVFKTASL